ncbi:MAG: NADH-quinone oxidoreductase subunit N [Planctomycetes bacterium]|nr:NADH-quinone oxidoreductase subunit N [Planctomycetota bacterium]
MIPTGDPGHALPQLLLPEGMLGLGLVSVLVADMLLPAGRRGWSTAIGVLACAGALAATLLGAGGRIDAMLHVDGVTQLARLGILALTAGVMILGRGESRRDTENGAWLAAVLGVAMGASVCASADNLIALWLGLEILSLASYVLAGWRAGDRRSAEAGMKYVLFGGVASAVMLFGMSHVFGMTGRLDFGGIGAAFAESASPALVVALVLASAGLTYKLALVPLHAYAPDVYEGAPAVAIALVGSVPKIGAVAALVHLLAALVPGAAPPSIGVALASIGVVSLSVAALTALAQRDAKRILAFSGIGHAGAIVLGLAVGPQDEAVGTAAFYLLAYAAANLGAFVCLAEFERTRGACSLEGLAGARRSQPWTTVALALCLFSLAGLPPFAGFLAKWNVLRVVLQSGLAEPGRAYLVWAAVAMILASAVAAWAYLLVVRAVLLGAPRDDERPPGEPMAMGPRLVLGACVVVSLAAGLWLDGAGELAATLATH